MGWERPNRAVVLRLALLAIAAVTLARPTVAADLPTFVANPAPADHGRFTVIEENDGLLPDGLDRHYTQGALFGYLSPRLSATDPVAPLYGVANAGGALPIFAGGPGVIRKFDVVFGQSIFTPVKYHDPVPDPTDRPFAGWLYTGGSLLQETNGAMLENLELLAGVVGPDALGKQVQQAFHSVAGFNNANLDQSWSHQLKNEPGIMLSYDRHWKVWRSTVFGIETDVIPEAGLTVGNVLTEAEGGVLARIGRNLGVDYGVPMIRPSMSGTQWFNVAAMTDPFGWYLFAGAQGRAVAHNIFLDGNTFANGPSVHKKILVADFDGGLALFWADWAKVSFTFTERTKEFTTQKSNDHFGSASLAVRF